MKYFGSSLNIRQHLGDTAFGDLKSEKCLIVGFKGILLLVIDEFELTFPKCDGEIVDTTEFCSA